MKLITKTVGLIVKVILYPLALMLEWTLLFMAILLEKIDELSEDNNGTH